MLVPGRMIDDTGLKVSDPVASRRFYEMALAPLGYRVLMEIPTEQTGGQPGSKFGPDTTTASSAGPDLRPLPKRLKLLEKMTLPGFEPEFVP